MIIIFICFIVYLCITLCIGVVNAKVNPSGARELAEFHPSVCDAPGGALF